MSDKLSEQLCMIAGALETTNPLRGRRIEHIAKKVAALEQQLAAKDTEIARLRDAVECGLAPQRSMTPEEVAGMRAYRETVFKRVAAEGDGLRDEVRACLGTLIDDICNHRTISALTRVTQLEDAIAALASAAWRVYLWGVELSEEQYHDLVFQVETMRREDEQPAQVRETT